MPRDDDIFPANRDDLTQLSVLTIAPPPHHVLDLFGRHAVRLESTRPITRDHIECAESLAIAQPANLADSLEAAPLGRGYCGTSAARLGTIPSIQRKGECGPGTLSQNCSACARAPGSVGALRHNVDWHASVGSSGAQMAAR
jgi:hypothetical protein